MKLGVLVECEHQIPNFRSIGSWVREIRPAEF